MLWESVYEMEDRVSNFIPVLPAFGEDIPVRVSGALVFVINSVSFLPILLDINVVMDRVDSMA